MHTLLQCAAQCQKLLFSATLSRDPAKIDALHLHRPVYISVEDALDPHAEDEGVDNELKFTFPAELSVRRKRCALFWRRLLTARACRNT